MIHAVIELGDQRIHEVMVPRIAMVVAAVVGHDRGGDRHGHRARATAGSRSTRRRSTRSSASSTPRTCCRSSSPPVTEPPGAALAAADAGLRARVDDRRRPAPRVPAAQGPHRDRARRVRRHGGPGHDRGPARGDRRRDPGRVRRGGADDRAALRRRGARSTAGPTSTTWPSCSTSSLGSRTRTSTTRSAGSIYHRIGGVPEAGRPGRGRRPDADRRDDRRAAGRQGPRRARAPGDDESTPRTTSSGPLGDGRRPGDASRRSGADDRDDDLLEAARGPRARRPRRHRARPAPRRGSGGPGRGCTRGRRCARGSRRSRRPRPSVGLGPRVELGQALAVLGAGVLEGVDDRQRLLVVGDVGRLLAGRLLRAPDAEQVVVELEGEAERPAEAAVARDDRPRRRWPAARRPRSRRRSAPPSCARSCRSRARRVISSSDALIAMSMYWPSHSARQVSSYRRIRRRTLASGKPRSVSRWSAIRDRLNSVSPVLIAWGTPWMRPERRRGGGARRRRPRCRRGPG